MTGTGIRMLARAGAMCALLAAGSIHAQGRAPIAQVRDALAAMGGEEAVRAMKTRQAEFRTANLAPGQDQWPGGPPTGFLIEGTELWDLERGRRATTTRFLGSNVTQRTVVSPDAAMVQRDTLRTPGSTAQIEATRTAYRLLPERLLLAALAAPGALAPLPPREWRGRTLERVRLHSGTDTVALGFDPVSRLLTLVERSTDDGVFGRRTVLTAYTRWGPVGNGVRLPHQVDVEIDGEFAIQTSLQAQRVNGAPNDTLFAIPAALTSAAVRAERVIVAELAPRLYHVAGGSHASLAVVQGDSMVVVEAPLSAARARAVLDTLASRFPGKPVRLVVATHHHVDHVGGIPTMFEAGIPVVAPDGSARYLAGIGPQAGRTGPARSVRPVRDSATIGAGADRLVLYSVPTLHADAMLVAYHPGARVLFQADLFPAAPEISRDLLAFVRARGLAVDRVAGAHGGVTPWAAFQGAVQP